MRNRIKKFYGEPMVRHYGEVVAFAVVVIGLALYGAYDKGLWPFNAATMPPIHVAQSTQVTLAAAEPTRIRIPAIDVDTTFETPLGVNDDGTIEVPETYEQVAYYAYGPTPGERGPAVVLGHVDSYSGPAVFWPLRKLESGDQILIDRKDGTTATFLVTRLEDHEQSGFPTRTVYGDLDHAGLRLITCSGTYDRNTLEYSHNLIVFAELATTTEQTSGSR